MSELYSVYVSDRPDSTTVDLRVKVVHPDSMYIYKTPGFYLMLLQECTDENNLLAEEVDYDSVTDAQWLKQYAKGFIKTVKILKLENKMPAAAKSNHEHKYWQDSSKWLSATVRVTVTHPGWCQHTVDGLSWESASYDPNSKYDQCAPIVPGSSEVVLSDNEEDRTGFLPIPNYFFEQTMPLTTPVWIPVYGEKAYVVGEKISGKDVTDSVWDSFLGIPAMIKNEWSEEIGVLCTRENGFVISSGSYGSFDCDREDLEWIARLKFNLGNKRLNEGLSYQMILTWVDAYIPEIQVEGTTATYKVYTFEPGKQLNFESAANPMELLCRSITDHMDEITRPYNKLAIFLNNEKDKRDLYSISELYSKLAGGIIQKYEINKLKEASHPDLDRLEHKELVEELLKEPWATWEIKLEVSDPAWIEHLKDTKPYRYGFYWAEAAEKWEGEPLVWPERE